MKFQVPITQLQQLRSANLYHHFLMLLLDLEESLSIRFWLEIEPN